MLAHSFTSSLFFPIPVVSFHRYLISASPITPSFDHFSFNATFLLSGRRFSSRSLASPFPFFRSIDRSNSSGAVAGDSLTSIMGLLDLFVAALVPVLKVLLLTAVGSLLAVDRIGILGHDARKHLNRVVFFVFNPSLVASSLAESLTFKSMVMLWFMPLNILITFIIGSILGWMLIKATKPPQELRGLILGCCAAGNLGNLPLIIIPAVCKEKGSPFGAVDVCCRHGLTYASLSMAIGAIYLWSYVYNIVRIYSTKTSEGPISRKSSGGNPYSISNSSQGPLLPSGGHLFVETSSDQSELPCMISEGNAKLSTLDMIKQRLNIKGLKIDMRMLFAPSTTGAFVGLVIGIVPQLRKAMIGDSAPLRVVQDSASLLGDAAIPTIILILGANLLQGLKGSEVQLPLIVGIVMVRYVALPVLGIVIVKGAVHFGLVQSDPLYQFTLLLQFALPPAMNIGTMTQLFGAGESECSVIMLSTYALASVSITLWSTLFLWLVS